jgi:hypothetical protein
MPATAALSTIVAPGFVTLRDAFRGSDSPWVRAFGAAVAGQPVADRIEVLVKELTCQTYG